ncbi:MAG TPA: RES family NAD+ phosphorylase [Nevskiaceae bacterium]|nr:RES family NAD+ phosphorylase [Nevskiaceae bacterium]
MADLPELSAYSLEPGFRVIPSRYPPVGLFDRVADPADLDQVFAIEALTNDRLREEVGQLQLVPRTRRIAGPGTSPIMAAFTHPRESRFSDGQFGVLYAASELEAAIEETKHHSARFLMATKEAPINVEMRSYVVQIATKRACDIRVGYDAEHDPDSYVASREFGLRARNANVDALVYRSVRKSGAHCVAAFFPDIVSRHVQHKHFQYAWNGRSIEHVLEMTLQK